MAAPRPVGCVNVPLAVAAPRPDGCVNVPLAVWFLTLMLWLGLYHQDEECIQKAGPMKTLDSVLQAFGFKDDLSYAGL